MPLSKFTNVATFRSAPEYRKYANFCSKAEITFDVEDSNPLISDETIIDIDEGDLTSSNQAAVTSKVRL